MTTPWLTASIEDLYDAVKIPGALAKRQAFEQFVSEMRSSAGTAAQPVIDEDGPVSGYAPTVPCAPPGERSTTRVGR